MRGIPRPNQRSRVSMQCGRRPKRVLVESQGQVAPTSIQRHAKRLEEHMVGVREPVENANRHRLGRRRLEKIRAKDLSTLIVGV